MGLFLNKNNLKCSKIYKLFNHFFLDLYIMNSYLCIYYLYISLDVEQYINYFCIHKFIYVYISIQTS